METISYTLPPEQDGATVRHILKAALHVSSHAISRLTRTENGIRVNGIHARTVDILHTGDVLEVETSDHRPPRVRPTPGPWPLPIVWEDGHLLVVNKPAGMTAHASNFLPDTPTVAGALGTYAKAILCDSPVYFSMVLPEPARELAWQTGLAPYQEVELEDSPFWTLGFHWHRPAWQAEWSVMNLLPDGAGGYTGTLFFSPLSEDNTYGIVYQQVAVRPDGDFWTVEPLGDLTVRPDPNQEGIYLCPSSEAPYTTYVAEIVTLHVEVDVQLQLNVNNAIFSTSTDLPAWASTYQLDPVPHPDASFTTMRDALGLRVSQKDTGEAVDLMVDAILMAHPAAPAAALLDTPYQYTLVPGELYEGPNMELSAMPAALALTFTYNGHTYTCTAYPAEVTP